MFPQQFDLKLSWNATVSKYKKAKDTNYFSGHIKIDQISNRMVVNTKFATLSLAPQEFVSYILDFNDKELYIRQKDSCLLYEIRLHQLIHNQENRIPFEFETLPNIAELFDLFPYVMYLKGIHTIDGKDFNVYKYSYPLGGSDTADEESEFLAFFNSETMELDKFVLTAKSLNITNPFTLYSAQPV